MTSRDQQHVDRLVAHLRGAQVTPNGHNPSAFAGTGETQKQPEGITDQEVLSLLFSERGKGARWEDAYKGAYESYYPSPSEAVAALLHKLAFYSDKDPAQMERLIRGSALAGPKFDSGRKGKTWIAWEIEKAIDKTGETYTPPNNNGRHRHRHPNNCSDGDGRTAVSISFAEMQEPTPPEAVWEGVIVRGWPALWFGGTGVTKSVLALAVAQGIADEDTKVFLGRDIITAPAMYADLELNAAVQGRRAYQIARGALGRTAPPPTLRYMTTYGAARRNRRDFMPRVLDECLAHDAEVCFIDSVGLAVSGNPGDFEVIVGFFEEVVADFTANGITPVLIDHQRRLIPGERNQALGAYGSVWKENLARTQAQIELVGRDREAHTVTTRLRPKKTNFGELPEPLEVVTTFSEEAISLERTETTDADRAGEETLSARERVLAALRTVEEAGPDEITEICQTLKRTTVRNVLTQLRNEEPPLIENTGNLEGRAHKVRFVTVTNTYRGDGDGDGRRDEDEKTPSFFAGEKEGDPLRAYLDSPPDWLQTQLKQCREDEAIIRPTCSTIAYEVYGTASRWQEVLPHVEKALGEWEGEA